MGVDNIRREMMSFQGAVRKLSTGVGNASVLWNDDRYSELSSSVVNIATSSRDVLNAGDRCCCSVDRFNSIAAEKY